MHTTGIMRQTPSQAEQPDGKPRLLLSTREAADAMGISERTLHTWVTDHGCPRIKIGRLVRFNPVELLEWASKREN